MAFTLIELLIVVAILAVLSAIAVPSYLDAQARSRTARAMADMRNLSTALEAYRIDHVAYPIGTTDPNQMNPEVAEYMESWAPGFHTFKVRAPGEFTGVHFATLTTPISYISTVGVDPFAAHGFESITPFSYWPARGNVIGYILTSVGPDRDLFAPDGRGNFNVGNPVSTAADPDSPAGIADINEDAAMELMEMGTGVTYEQSRALKGYLEELSYDPTNGTFSDGDIYRASGL
jgi:prepilin-type N-terminal cleavage/methylation domain-containing protein